MRYLARRPVSLAVLCLWAAACGSSQKAPKPQFPENPGSITIGADRRGLPIELNRSYPANRNKYATHAQDVSALFIYEQIWSEYEQATQGASGHPALNDRIDALLAEYPDELAAIPTHYLVVDLQRLDREWIVDWKGLTRDEPANRASLNFGRRDDYWPDVQARLEAAVQSAHPDAVIIGMEMNRYYDQNPDDWSNFVDFYWTMRAAIQAVDPNVRVGPGLNWCYLMEYNVAGFLQGAEVATDVAPFQRAWDTIVAPLIDRPDGGDHSDFLGLAAIPDPALFNSEPSNVTDQEFAGLRLELPEGTLPTVWFQIGWPSRSAGSAAPAAFYQRFLDLAGGFTIERVSWWGLTHLIAPDCTPLTGSQIGASETICFRGIFSVSGADTALAPIYFQ